MKRFLLYALFSCFITVNSFSQQIIDNGPLIGNSQLDEYAIQGSMWNTTNLKYYIYNTSSHLTYLEREIAIQNAFNNWSNNSVLTFTQVNDPNNADLIIKWTTGDHGDGNPFDGPGFVLAHAFYPPPGGGIYAGNLHFDDTENWSIGDSGIDLETVALHEIGHLLGIAHSSDTNAIMYPYYNGIAHSLTADDCLAIWDIYGCPCSITGSDFLYNTSIYSISKLPSFFSVIWSLSGYNSQNFFVENDTPSHNKCRITRLNYQDYPGTNLTLTANIKYNGTTVKTLSRQLVPSYIEGPTVPCGVTVYSVYPEFQADTVIWETDGQNLNLYTAPNGMSPYPSPPYSYVINPASSDYVYGTLTANIVVNDIVVGILNKVVDSSDGFTGTWYQQATLNDTINSTPKPFYNQSRLEFIPGRKVYLTSDHFIGANVSHSENGFLVYGWSNNNGVISFTPIKMGANNGSITLEGSYPTGCKKFRLWLYNSPTLIDDPILLSMNTEGNTYEFSICQNEESRQSSSCDLNILDWHLTIIKIDSANKVVDEKINGLSKNVNVSGWSSGIYMALAQINNQYYSLKFYVK